MFLSLSRFILLGILLTPRGLALYLYGQQWPDRVSYKFIKVFGDSRIKKDSSLKG
jgi:hypothetical protein